MVKEILEFIENIKIKDKDKQIGFEFDKKVVKVDYKNDQVVVTAADTKTNRIIHYTAHCVVSTTSIGVLQNS